MASASTAPGSAGQPAYVTATAFVAVNLSCPSKTTFAGLWGTETVLRSAITAPALITSDASPGGVPLTGLLSPQTWVVACVGFATSASYPSSKWSHTTIVFVAFAAMEITLTMFVVVAPLISSNML